MTEPAHFPEPPGEPDNVSGPGATRILLGGLVILAASILWAFWLLSHDLAALGHPRSSPNGVVVVAARSNGRVEQTLIEDNASGWDRRRAAERALSGYRWVDRGRGILHIPIDQAMALVIRRGAARVP